MNDTINDQAGTISDMNDTINDQAGTISDLNDTINDQAGTISDMNNTINELEKELNDLKAAKNTTIVINPITDAKYNTDVTITGTLVNEDSVGLFNQVVTLTIGDKTVDVITQGGVFEYTTSFKTLEEQTVTAAYAGNDKYQASEDTITFTLEKGDVIVTVDPITDVVYGDNVTITGKFTTSDGKAISNSNVKITINDKKYYAKTDKTGAYTLSAKVTSVGENNVTVGYSGNTNYNAYETTATFNVEKQDVIVTVDPIADAKLGENITITGTFTDANGKAIANSNVKITINGKKYYAKTDSTGTYTLTTTVTSAGINNITVGYSGNDKYNAYEETVTVNVGAQDVIVTYEPIDDVTIGENVTIKGTFTDANGKAIKNSNVKITIDGKKYYAKTDSTGDYTFTAEMTKAGEKTVTIGYSGSDKYNEYVTETSFVVLEKA